ncbi:MAG TPA: hypothetical protein VMU95_30710 [Trebonia sp.]|nr:hypothetical protein [Trebonia sp.]
MVTAEHADGPTWRPSVSYRVVNTVILAVFAVAISLLAWGALPTGGLSGWWLLVIAVPLWLWLSYRAWTLSATLTPDALVARGLLSVQRIPVANITAVAFSTGGRGQWALLIVTTRRGRHVILAVPRSLAAARTRRVEADVAADAIRAAAGLSH